MNCVGNFSLYLIFIRVFTLKTPGMPHRIRPSYCITNCDATLACNILLILLSSFAYFPIDSICENTWTAEDCLLGASHQARNVKQDELYSSSKTGGKKTCISRLVGANVNDVGADHIIGLTSLQSQLLFLEYTEARGRASQVQHCGPG